MMRKAKVKDRIMDVMTIDEYKNKQLPIEDEYAAVLNGDTIYPIRGRLDNGPGVYSNGTISKFIKPSEESKHLYSSDNMIDFTNAKNISEVIKKQNELRLEENAILTTVDNIYVPRIGDNDEPEMIALKTAIKKKEIDLDKYKPRFGSNSDYNNDKRELEKSRVSFPKIKKYAKVFGLKIKLVISDENDRVPNPIGEEISVDLTSTLDEE